MKRLLIVLGALALYALGGLCAQLDAGATPCQTDAECEEAHPITNTHEGEE